MNDNASFERFVAEEFAHEGRSRPPDALHDDILSRAAQTRQRPVWFARIKEPPMRFSSSLAVGSPTARVAAIIVATLLLALTVAGAGIAGSRLLAADGTIIVDPSGGGTTTTITEAVAMAKDGDTILVRPGKYTEAFDIDKDITLMGDGAVEDIVITAPEGGPMHDTRFRGHGDISWPGDATYAVLLIGVDARLSGLTLRGEPARLFADGGAPLIENMSFEGVGEENMGSAVVAAVVINGDSSATVRDSSFNGGGGIDVYEGAEPLIEGNLFMNGPGIFGLYGGNTIIRGNELLGSGDYGVSFSQSDGGASASGALVERNLIADRRTGVKDVVATSIIEDNTISDSELSGISVYSGEVRVVGNELTNNATGISWSAAAGLIDGNSVSGGQSGIVVGSGSPTVTGNAVEGVEGNALVVGFLASPSLSGNTSCGNGRNLFVLDNATPEIDETNEICEDATPG